MATLGDEVVRTLSLGVDRIHWLGRGPRRGGRPITEWTIPPAGLADKPLATGDSIINQYDLRAARPDAAGRTVPMIVMLVDGAIIHCGTLCVGSIGYGVRLTVWV